MWRRAAYGQHDASWLGFYDFFRRHTNIDVSKLDGMTGVARSASWWWPFRGAVILTDRPEQLQRDAQGRLHNGAGPAVGYRDGFGVHAWHGTRVPADMHTWDVQRTLKERNTEIRRCAIERVGWDAFITAAGLREVATCQDPGNDGHPLALYDLPPRLQEMYPVRARVLLCVNGSVERDGTRRRYGLVVPGHHTDPIVAAAELYDMPAAAYRELEVRR